MRLSFLALQSLLVVSGYGDHPIRTRNLELVVDVACPGVELVVCWPAKNHMVGTLEGHHLECDFLLAVVINITEGH